MAPVYIALIHYPIYNKRKDIVSTCITGFDLHDIARTAATFGIKKYFVVNPLPAQQQFAQRIFDFWMGKKSMEFNWTRAEAFKLVSVKENLEAAILEISQKTGKKPKIIATSAKPRGNIEYADLKEEVKNSEDPYLLLFGTGGGMADEVFDKVDATLGPINGAAEYNHLPVRSAIAIILDRLLGG